MNNEADSFPHFPRVRMFTREILLAAAITLAAFVTFFGPPEAPEFASTEVPTPNVTAE